MSPFPARSLAVLLSASALTACASIPPPVALAIAPPQAAAAPAAAAPAPLPSLIADVKIPHTKFVLENGLTVLVHEDHKAPGVARATW